ncbi:MAG: endonuclease/exonuclease/phosphatase family protein [Candidatus Woesearchaeota archaeon]
MSENIKVMSFNLEFCASVTKGYWQYLEFFWKYLAPHNINAIFEVIDIIAQEGIGIAVLTEMEGISRRTHHRNYLEMILGATPLKNSVFYPVNRWWFDIGNRGNAIMSKYDMIESKNIKLKTKIENRYLSIGKFIVNNKTIHVLTTQLSLGRRDRIKEFRQIVEIVNSIKGPIILAGDLNTQNEFELEVFNHTRLKRVITTNTFPSWRPKRRIDYIFYSPEFEVVESYVLDYVKVSDHLPVIAELKLTEGQSNKNTKARANRIVRNILNRR